MNEFEIIDLIRQRMAALGEPAATLMAADDCAVLAQTSEQTCLSVDTLIADTHFPAAAPPELIGRRALALCASDLAAMGASPRGCLLSLGLPPQHNNKEYISALADGIAKASSELALPLLGGNLSKSDMLFLAITVVGSGEQLLSRAGAAAGDDIYISGTLGDAAAALDYLDRTNITSLNRAQQKLVNAYYLPPPRLTLGAALRGVAHCCIDVSDGLVADLMHLLQQNEHQLQAVLNLAALPCSPELEQEISAVQRQELMLYSGDDYELLFTAPARAREKISELTHICPITKIGELKSAKEHSILGISAGGEEQQLTEHKSGYRHF